MADATPGLGEVPGLGPSRVGTVYVGMYVSMAASTRTTHAITAPDCVLTGTCWCKPWIWASLEPRLFRSQCGCGVTALLSDPFVHMFATNNAQAVANA